MIIDINNEQANFSNKTIFVDTETINLYGEVRLVQVYCPEYDKDTVFVYDIKQYPLILVKKRLREASLLVGHNFKYDMDCLDFIPENWEDTYLIDTVVGFRADKHSLDELAIRKLRTDPYRDMFRGKGAYPNKPIKLRINGKEFDVVFTEDDVYDKKKLQKSDWSGVLSRTQYAYAALDVWILPYLYNEADIAQAGFSYKLDKKTVTTFAKMGQKLPINKEWLENKRADNLKKIDEFNLPINVNSWKQVRPYIDSEQSDDEALARLCSDGNQRACDVRTVRSLRKQISFIDKFLAEQRNGYIHGHLNVGTRSGRSKCANMNLQQIPTSLKECIQTDKLFVYADFAQLEIRSLCVLIGEEILENLFRTKQDIHDYTKNALFTSETHVSDAGRGNSLRQIAKIYNFASLYGAGWFTIGTVLTKYTGIQLKECELKINKVKWLQGFPGIKRWHDENIRHWQAKRTLHTPMGRPYIGKLPTDTNNIMNQGLGAEVAKVALIYMDKSDLDMSKMLMFIHDSYTYEADTMEEAKHAGEIMAHAMQKAWVDITVNCKIKDLPMPVDVFIGKNMKTIDKEPIYEISY